MTISRYFADNFLKATTKIEQWRSQDLYGVKFYRAFLVAIGIWPRLSDHKGLGFTFRKWAPLLVYAVGFYNLFLGFPVLAYLSWGKNIHVTTEAIACVFISLLTFAHLGCPMYQTDALEGVCQNLVAVREAGNRLTHQPKAILEETKKFSEWPLAYFIGSLIGFASLFTLAPKLIAMRRFIHTAWYPFDETATPNFELTFVLTILANMYMLLTILCLDCLLLTLLIEVRGQLRLLSYNLSRVSSPDEKLRAPVSSASKLSKGISKSGGSFKWNSPQTNPNPTKKKENRKENSQIQSLSRVKKPGKTVLHILNCSSVYSEQAVKERLRSCVRHHQMISSLVGGIQDVFEVILLWLFITAVVSVGLGLALILFADSLETRTLMHVMVTLAVTSFSGLVCWMGNMVIEESDLLRDAVFGSDWLGSSDSVQRSMRIILSRSNQPLRITVARFIPLSLETYYSMMMMTFSYTKNEFTYFNKMR